MTKLNHIAGLTPPVQRLLEAGGIASVEALAQQEAGALAKRLAQSANTRGGEPVISRDDAGRLVLLARQLLEALPPAAGGGAVSVQGGLKVNLDEVPEAIAISAPRPAAPVATTKPAAAPIPLRPASVAAPASARPMVTETNDPVRAKSATPARPEPAKPKFRDFQAYAEGRAGIDPLPRKPDEDEDEVEGALRRANYKPGEPVPRLVRRGVPHPRPVFLVFCSLIVVASRLLMMAVIIGTPLVLWPAFVRGDKTHLFSFLWVIGAWLLSCLFYLMFALRARCRVCTNQIFWSKRCFKNQKAHRLPGLGLVGSLALHALIFGWFRCMYCGTAIRLKFVADPERSK